MNMYELLICMLLFCALLLFLKANKVDNLAREIKRSILRIKSEIKDRKEKI